MKLAHRITLDPTVKQHIALARAAGTARFTYNWALSEWTKQYKSGLKPTALKLKKQFNQIKRTQFPWVYDSPKDANQRPFSNLKTAFSRFFKKTTNYPKFKKRGQHDSFYVSNDRFEITDKVIKLPVIGDVKLTESLRLTGKILGATISRKADRWYVSIIVDIGDFKESRVSSGEIGVDLGLINTVVTSNNHVLNAPKPLKKNLRRLSRLNRRLHRKVKGSKNRLKARLKVAKLHARIAHIRNDFLHKTTTQLCRENQAITIEKLSVKNMQKSRRLGRAISDVGFYEFRRQLQYKSEIYGVKLTIADQYFPSSQICSNCGNRKELSLNERVYVCTNCGVSIDRDLNAAINLLTLGSRGTYDCGLSSSTFGIISEATGKIEAVTIPCSLVDTK